jgi:hypothetical protein
MLCIAMCSYRLTVPHVSIFGYGEWNVERFLCLFPYYYNTAKDC